MEQKYLAVLLVLALLSDLVVCRRGGGGGGGGRSGGGGGLFGGRRSSSSSWGSSNSRSSYPKQQWGSNTGSNTGSNYPKQQYGAKNTQSNVPIGGGGFVNPKGSGSNLGGGNYGSRGYGSSNYGSSGGTGGVPNYSYRNPGYGTNYGTSFTSGRGMYGGSGMYRKPLGLGVGAGFLGGAAIGLATGVATMSVYHRYQEYKRLMYMNQYGHYNDNYYNSYYSQNRCYMGCSMNSHCEYGICECNNGFRKSYGQCYRDDMSRPSRSPSFDPFQPCTDTISCQTMDMNLICNTNLTVGAEGRCECRTDLKWNTETLQCQIYLDVDCSSITYETKPSPIILKAVNKTLDKFDETDEIVTDVPDNETISAEESLENSLLSSIDPKEASKDEIKEAFCRDIDSFSFELSDEYQTSSAPTDGGGNGSIGILTLFVIIIVACCALTFICKGLKKAKDKLGNLTNPNRGKDMTGVADIQPEVVPNPGYQPQPTPLHALPYPTHPNPPVAPAYPSLDTSFHDPAPIPPTQPGYTNSFPPIDVNSHPLVPTPEYSDQQLPYPPQQPYPSQPYPAPGYPPASLPYPAPGYPETSQPNSAPGYPPTSQPNQAPGYPPTSQPYPASGYAGTAPGYNPITPYPNANPPPYNPSAPI